MYYRNPNGITILFTSKVERTKGKKHGAQLLHAALVHHLANKTDKLFCELIGSCPGDESCLNFGPQASEIVYNMIRRRYDQGGILILPVIYE